MGMYFQESMYLSFCLWVRFVLYFSISSSVTALINKRCITFDERFLGDIGLPIPCDHRPGFGLYAQCNISDFQSELSEVKERIRFLCIYSKASDIPDNVFSHLPSLEYLQITGLNLISVHSGAFSGLVNLKYLKVFFNDEECNTVEWEPPVFAGLDHVQELFLKGFRLANAPNTIFDHLVGLVRLDLGTICVEEISEVFCRIPNGMSYLEQLTLTDSGIISIKNRGCPSLSHPWPLTVLARIQTLDLNSNQIQIIEADSLAVFQNLSRFSLGFCGASLGSVLESRVGHVDTFELSGDVLHRYSTNVKDMCQLVAQMNIYSLTLNHIHLDTLSTEDEEDCGSKLRELVLSFSKVQHLDPMFWTNMTGLQIMYMVNMELTEAPFCVASNGTMWNLTFLNLAFNHLMVVQTHQFVCMPLLQQLFLNNNAIKTVEPEGFSGLLHLKVLQLNSNHIKVLATNDFQFLQALEVLFLDNNMINSLEDGTFRNLQELRELTLGRLEFVYTLHLNMLFYGFPENIQRLNIDAHEGTTIYFGNTVQPKRTFKFELNGNIIQFHDGDSSFFQYVRELKLNGSIIYTKAGCAVQYFTNLESLELSGDPERVSVDYTGINHLHNLKHLKLINLNFYKQTNTGEIFLNLKRLQTLVLYNCRLSFLTKRMFSDLQSLELLHLYSVSPMTLQDGMFDILPALKNVVFGRVDFRCDCRNGWLLEWAGSTHVQVVNMQQQQCIWHYQKLNFLFTMEKLCQTDVQYLCSVATAAAVALLLSAALGYRFARWPCVVLFFRLRGYVERKIGRMWRMSRRVRQRDGEQEEEEEVKYDAFVSFSSCDEAWVMGQLAPTLEEQGSPRLRLCLHSRDFEVGKGIVDNIAESIYSSRRTVCVLSRRYLRSDWCSLEMRMATHRLLEEQKHHLILIFLEHISPFDISAFHRLAKLLKSRTYLDWPQDESERIHFWERLRRSIAQEDTDAAHG
ncbi:toll-like receptor 12 [Brachyhypopomus gauderio]|uniref:toll-like receptor 12 n=1 Tax=Brachyhypopomus gauderio TaxID=698409 RepID=UPI00404348A5